ncbi:hypothetical protein E2C01_003885 [Portunus trituberculatus]|uniref:Uncharacterized protein n=1 Tax=Portunus trituberculatus TaxID=210409 RepID=A0A5B7CRD7_PORTR|nr:hypothetical protein [Portunus trituberculatus]
MKGSGAHEAKVLVYPVLFLFNGLFNLKINVMHLNNLYSAINVIQGLHHLGFPLNQNVKIIGISMVSWGSSTVSFFSVREAEAMVNSP